MRVLIVYVSYMAGGDITEANIGFVEFAVAMKERLACLLGGLAQVYAA